MSRVVYAFELRGIQGYLFNTGRLRDMIHASELIDYVCGQPLDQVLLAVGADPHRPQPRRAGGAAYLVMENEAQARRFRDLWAFTVLQLLPGIELVDALGTASTVREAVTDAIGKLQVARNQPCAQLPAATPLTELAPRTGEPAVARQHGESLDASTFVRRQAQRKDAGLTARFGSTELHWPNNFEEGSPAVTRFHLNADNFVGMLHLDGNGIGILLRVLNEAASNLSDEEYVEVYQTFSTKLEQVCCEAAQRATSEILIPARHESGVMPARPLVLGGDDLSILLRSDLAVPFAMAYAHHFEALSESFINELAQRLKTAEFPAQLTTSGGLVLVKPGFPFSQALALAEGFAGIAKARGVDDRGNKLSALALYRVQGAVGDDAGALFEREQRVGNIGLGLAAYGLTEASRGILPQLEDLRALAEVGLERNFSKARLRSLVSLMYQSLDLARSDYHRWRELMKKNAGPLWARFEELLTTLVGELDADLPCSKDSASADGGQVSPINDLLILLETELVSPLRKTMEKSDEPA